MFLDQSKLFRSRWKSIIYYFLYVVLMFFLGRMFKNEFLIFKEFFPKDYLLLLVPLILSILALICFLFIRRVLLYWIFDMVLSLTPIGIMYFAFFVSSTKSFFGEYSILFWGFFLMILIIIFWAGVKQQEVAFNRATPYNIKSGVLNLSQSTWDISKRFYYDSPNKLERAVESGYKLYFWLSAVATGIGFLLARNLSSSDTKFMFIGLYYLVAAVSTYVTTPKMNLVLQTLRWERETGKKLMIKSGK